MAYSRKTNELSQEQAIENMKAILESDKFQDYGVNPTLSRIRSNLIDADSIGNWKEENPDEFYQVNDLANMINTLLNTVEESGVLYEAQIQIVPPRKKVRDMNFEERLYNGELRLPLAFRISEERNKGTERTYSFNVSNHGIERDYLESHGLNFDDASRKLNVWYAEIDRTLEAILPHKVRKVSPFL